LIYVENINKKFYLKRWLRFLRLYADRLDE